MARRRRRAPSSASAAISRSRCRTRRRASTAFRQLDLTVNIATKLNRTHLLLAQGDADPALPRPHRDRRAGRRAAGGDGRGFDVDGPRLARRLKPGVRASALRARDRRRHGARDPARQRASTGTGLVADYDRIRDLIEAVFPGLSTTTTPASATPGGFRLTVAACRARLEHRRRQGAFPRLARATTRTEARRTRRAADADHAAQPRPVQHHDLRHERPLSRRHRPPRRACSPTPRTWRRAASPPATASTCWPARGSCRG